MGMCAGEVGVSNERIEVPRRRASKAFEDLIIKHWGIHYAEKGETIAEVWITHESESGSVTGYDVITTPKRPE